VVTVNSIYYSIFTHRNSSNNRKFYYADNSNESISNDNPHLSRLIEIGNDGSYKISFVSDTINNDRYKIEVSLDPNSGRKTLAVKLHTPNPKKTLPKPIHISELKLDAEGLLFSDSWSEDFKSLFEFLDNLLARFRTSPNTTEVYLKDILNSQFSIISKTILSDNSYNVRLSVGDKILILTLSNSTTIHIQEDQLPNQVSKIDTKDITIINSEKLKSFLEEINNFES